MDIQDEVDKLLLAIEELKLALLLYNASITLVIEQSRLDMDRELHSIRDTDNILRKAYNPAEPRDSKGRWTKGSLLVTMPPNIGDIAVTTGLKEELQSAIDNIDYCSPQILDCMYNNLKAGNSITTLGRQWVASTMFHIAQCIKRRLAIVTCHYSRRLSHIPEGLPMSFMVANGFHANSRYIMEDAEEQGYQNNCIACVVAFEARLRGYDVEACPNTSGSVVEKLSLDPNRVWVDPTGHHPAPIEYTGGITIGLVYWLKANIVQGQRYTLQYKGRNKGRHIVSVLYNEGELTIYDPQDGTIVKDRDITDHIDGLKLDLKKGVYLTRIDNCSFNLDMIESVVRKRR